MKVLVFACFALFFLSSCSPRLSLNVRQDESGTFSFATTMGKTVETTIRAFSNIDETAPIFDKKSIESSFANAGFTLSQIDLPNKTDLSLSGKTANIRDFGTKAAQPFFIQTNLDGGGSLKVKLSPETANALLRLMPQETSEYIDLLLAPLFTGETMTGDEYVELIGAMYGKNLAVELRDENLLFSISVPGTIKAVSVQPDNAGSFTKSGKTASFDFPLPVFLANSKELLIQVDWGK